MDRSGDDAVNPTHDEDIEQAGASGDMIDVITGNVDLIVVLMQMILRRNESLISRLASTSFGPEEISWSPVLIESLPAFSDRGDFNEASNWLKILRKGATLYRWPEASKLEVARVNLEGLVCEWYAAQGFESWLDFERAFKKKFVSKLNVTDHWTCLIKGVRQNYEDVLSYCSRRIRMCQVLELDFKDVKGLVLDGMRNVPREFLDYLWYRPHLNEDDLLMDVELYLKNPRIHSTGTGAGGNVQINTRVRTEMNSNAVLIETIQRQNELLVSILESMSLRKENVYCSPVVITSFPAFNGRGDSIANDASNWLKTWREAATLYRWSEASRLEVARVNLKGPARRWYTLQYFKSWINFEQQFEKKFIKKPSVAIRWKFLIERVQGNNENVWKYSRDKIEMCKELELDLKDVKDLVLDGMGPMSPEFFNYILGHPHFNEDDLLNDIMGYLISENIPPEFSVIEV